MSSDRTATEPSRTRRYIRWSQIGPQVVLGTLAAGLGVVALYCFATDTSRYHGTTGKIVDRKLISQDGWKYEFTCEYKVDGTDYRVTRVAHGVTPIGGAVHVHYSPRNPSMSVLHRNKVSGWLAGLVAVGLAIPLATGSLLAPKLASLLVNRKHARIAQLIETTTESKLGAIRDHGFVKVRGRITKADTIGKSPLTDTPCVYFKFEVFQSHSNGQAGTSSTQVVHDVWCAQRILIQDETGDAIIELNGADTELVTDTHITSGTFNSASEHVKAVLGARYGQSATGLVFSKQMSYFETILEPHDDIAVIGYVSRDSQGRVRVTQRDDILLISDVDEQSLFQKYLWSAVSRSWFAMATLIIFTVVLCVVAYLMFHYWTTPFLDEVGRPR